VYALFVFPTHFSGISNIVLYQLEVTSVNFAGGGIGFVKRKGKNRGTLGIWFREGVNKRKGTERID
jgi:hypothetical protein